MTNRLTVPYEEIENRLAICCEFLLDKKKPIEEAYDSLMKKLGTQLMEYTEFEYWFKRFQNNQFDLGYDTSQDSKKISKIQKKADEAENNVAGIIKKEDQVEVVEREAKRLKSNIQFKTEELHRHSRVLMRELSAGLKIIDVYFTLQFCVMKFDETSIRLDRSGKLWDISYGHSDKKSQTRDPEKSIINHLWFALKSPSMSLGRIKIELNREGKIISPLNLEKLEALLQSMLDTFDHQIETSTIIYKGFNESTFFSLLKHIRPETLSKIDFDISWKQEGNYRILKEIVETDQWRQAKTIYSRGVAPLRIEEVLHCEVSQLTYDRITPEDVLRVTEHFFDSIGTKCCTLYSGNKKIDECRDIDAILNALLSQNNETDIIRTHPLLPQYKFRFKVLKSEKCVFLNGNKNYIVVQKF